MRPEKEEIEFHTLFLSNTQHLRFALEEMGKMIEARLEKLSRHVYENDLKTDHFQTSREDIRKTIDGFKYSVKSLCENLKNEFKISLDKIDPELQEDNHKIENFVINKTAGR